MVKNICNSLDSSRFEITLVYNTRYPTEPQDFEASFNKNIRKIYLPEMVRSINLKKDIIAFRKLYRLFREEKPDVVHGHSSKAGFLTRIAGMLAGISKIFYSSHGYSFRMTDVSVISKGVFFLAEAIVSPIGYIVVNAPNELNIAGKLAWRSDRVLPYYNGIEISDFIPQYPQTTQELNVVSCGRVTAAKNPSAFVRLCARIANIYPEVKFTWIGDGSEKQMRQLRQTIEQLDIKNIRITGWLEASSVRQELANADLVIHYSDWDVLPTAVSEAMALGKPVVGSTAVDQIQHRENGFVAQTEDQLFEYTSQLLDSPELKKRMGKKARETIEEQYTLDRLIAQLENAYSRT